MIGASKRAWLSVVGSARNDLPVRIVERERHTLKSSHLELIHRVGCDVIALQEAAAGLHASLTARAL
jgi:hypothetical protein